jgi:hypothetical protein
VAGVEGKQRLAGIKYNDVINFSLLFRLSISKFYYQGKITCSEGKAKLMDFFFLALLLPGH